MTCSNVVALLVLSLLVCYTMFIPKLEGVFTLKKGWVPKFKNRQKQLAKKMAKKIGASGYKISYEQQIPGIITDRITGKTMIIGSQVCLPGEKVVYGHPQRIHVYVSFQGKKDLNPGNLIAIHRILKTRCGVNGATITYSINPHNYKV